MGVRLYIDTNDKEVVERLAGVPAGTTEKQKFSVCYYRIIWVEFASVGQS